MTPVSSTSVPAPGLVPRLERAFRFHPNHLEAASKTLAKISDLHKSRKKKKKSKKKQDPVFVGIHCRRTDHDHFEREKGMVPLRPSYFLQAMDMYR